MTRAKNVSDFFVVSADDSLGVVDVRGDSERCVLLLHNLAIAMQWPANDGSICELLARSGRVDFADDLAQLREVAAGAVEPNVEGLRPLWQLFVPDHYEVRIDDIEGAEEISWENDAVTMFYPSDSADLIQTRRRDQLDEARIAHFRDAIRSGKRPLVFLIGAHSSLFVLDGHHKLSAYMAEKIPPRCAAFWRVDPPLVSEDEMLTYLETPSRIEAYRAARKRGR